MCNTPWLQVKIITINSNINIIFNVSKMSDIKNLKIPCNNYMNKNVN